VGTGRARRRAPPRRRAARRAPGRGGGGAPAGGRPSIAFGAAIFWKIRDFPELPGGYPGPALFPGILATLFIVFGLALLMQVARGTVVGQEGPQLPPEAWTVAVPNAAAVILAVPAYVLLAPRLGFVLTMALVSIALMLKLRVGLLTAVLVSVGVAFAASYVFADVLRVPLPRGPIGR
jgi:putative tricarboxylic transport membrane protein